MRRWGGMAIGILAGLALLALSSASALAATPIEVTETTDAPLESGASACESTDAKHGCTLRAAVELADEESGAVTIEVPKGTYAETISNPTLVVEDDAEVTISGAGAGKTIIKGDANGGVFEAEDDSSLTLDGVTVKNGDAYDGGGVFVSSFASLRVDGSTIAENTADAYGGGIFGDRFSYIDVKASAIEHNDSREDGGGIYAEEDEALVEDSSAIAHNHAQYHGGAIYAEGGEFIIKDSTIAANDAEYDGGGIDGARAYIAVEEQSTVTENESTEGDGGGIATFTENGYGEYEDCEELYGELVIEQSTISDNRAAIENEGDGGGVFGETDEFGCDDGVRGGASARHAATPRHSSRAARRDARPADAIEFVEGGAVTVEQSTIVSNEAGYYGGGIMERGGGDPIVNSTITENVAGDEGGGVYVGEEELATLISDTVAYNKLDSDGGGDNLSAEDQSEILLRNTIVAEEKGESEDNCEGEIESLAPDAGYNLDYPSKAIFDSATDSCGLSEADHDLVGVEPGFEGGLEDHGGPTETIALGAASQAIGVVPLAGDCEQPSPEGPGSVDQRGEPRPGISGDGCDIGAYEYQGSTSIAYSLSLAPSTGEEEAGEAHTHSVTATVTEEEAPRVLAHAKSEVATPVSKADVAFTIAGRNSGVTGKCTTPEGVSDPSCETNSEGKVVFTYADSNGAGTDTIEASTVLDETPYEATASMKWTPAASLSLAPSTGEEEAGEAHTHSVTATVTEEAAPIVIERAATGAMTPVSKADVAFTVAGRNSGVTGKCTTPEGVSDPSCETNSEGKVVFTYADKKGAGTDTIGASAELGGKKHEATASMTWTAPPATTSEAKKEEPKKEVLSVKIVSPAQCASQRDITIHIQNVKQLGIVSAVVSIDGKDKRTLTGKHLTTAINLRGLPKGTFTVEIVASTRSGRTLKGKRVYHTCHTKLPGHSYLPL